MSKINPKRVIELALVLRDKRVESGSFREQFMKMLKGLYMEEIRAKKSEVGEDMDFETYLDTFDTLSALKEGHATEPDAFVIDRGKKEIVLYLIDCGRRPSMEEIRGFVELATVLFEDLQWSVKAIVIDCFGSQREIDYYNMHDAFMYKEAKGK